MGDMGEIFNEMRQHDKERKAKNLDNSCSDGWKKHTAYHWSRYLNNKRLDYWPSRNKFMYQGHVMCGNIESFIRKRS